MRWVLVIVIRIYQLTISPLLGERCRFYPSCSEYSKEAIIRFGVLKGLKLSLTRLLRCNPLFPGGYNPIPKGPLPEK